MFPVLPVTVFNSVNFMDTVRLMVLVLVTRPGR